MSDKIGVATLQTGDVLLYSGTSWISRAIQFFDGTPYSHAALYLGDGQVGEAVAEGLVRRGLAEGLHGNTFVEARRLKDRPTEMDKVIAVANAYLDGQQRYGFEQLLLLAMLCLTRKLKITPTLRALVRRALDAAAAVISRLIADGREPMICSEYVYRCYEEALPEQGDHYSIELNYALPMIQRASLEGGMPQAAPRGRGVHPHSLLASLAAPSTAGWMPPAAARPARALAATEAADAARLDLYIETYLQEAVAGAVGVQKERVTLEDLHASAQHFATALYAAEQAAHSAGAPGAGVAPALQFEGARETIWEYLWHTAADFVTPADLSYTQSLYQIGRLDVNLALEAGSGARPLDL